MTDTTIISAAPNVVDRLLAALGPDIVTLAGEAEGRRFADWSGIPAGDVLALIRPRSTEELSQAMAICHAAGQPVTVQGGLTGLAGGASALDGEIAVSLERMKAIEEVDVISATMTVQAGCVLQSVQEAAIAAGYFFPLDLGARGSCTIGGVLATNAGGNRVIKYGMARDLVLGVEAVLADGRIISGLHKMLKNNSGYDLKNLLIGSEGTLGIITRVVLRLRPRPLGVSTAWCGLDDFTAVTTLLRRAQSELAGGVSAFEVMWPSYYDYVLGNFPELRRPLAGKHGFYVLLETDGADPEAQGEQFEAFLARMFEEEVLEDAAVAMSERAALDFWALRDAPGEFPRLIPNMIAFDISFAVSDLAEAASRITKGLDERYPGSLALVYGHLGDGNIHLIADVPGATVKTVETVEAFVYGVVSELGGSVSAEHGIGLKKRKVLSRTRTPDELATMTAIKQALDPNNILGRGRILRMTASLLPFREQLDWDAVPGQVVDGAIRYMLIRPDALMGAITRLSPDARAEMLAALHASVLDFGGRSAGAYNETATRPLVEVVAQTAPDLGWGRWTISYDDDAIRITVEDSPFAAPVIGAAQPMCMAMTGMLSAVGAIMGGAPVTAIETRCAAQHGGTACYFTIPLEHAS